jgi:plastocyanin
VRPRHWSVLAAVVLATALAAGCGGGDDDDDNPMNPGGGTPDVTINILGDNGSNSYDPDPDTVTVGQTVAWHNSNGIAHTATSDPGSTAIGTGTVSPGSRSAAKLMNTAGTFTYHCAIHPGMTGTLVVRP